MSLILRPYQRTGVDKLRASFRAGKRAPLYVLPTGGGKTAVFSYIAQNSVARGRSVTILVHRHELLMQSSRSLSRLEVRHGVVSPRFAGTSDKVQVASVQTLVRRLERHPAPDLIIIDEAHHAPAGSYRKVLAAYPKAHVLGVTATPCRTAGQGLDDIFDDLILGPSIASLIRDGYLARAEIYAPPVGIDLVGVHRVAGDFDRKELGERVDKPKITGDVVAHYRRICPGEPAIAFCVSVAHAEHVAAEFRAAGVRALRVDGAMDDAERRIAIDGLGSGSVDVLTSADLIGEGVDIPRVSAAILLRPTQSLSLYLQQVGRALRPYEGKTRATILDHVGNVVRHGFPDEDREWTLAPRPKGGGSGPGEGPAVRIDQCHRCYFIFETGPSVCPNCGDGGGISRARKIEVSPGELRKLEREEIERQRRSARQEVGRARTLPELIAIGRARGYASPEYWARSVFGARKAGV